MNEEREEAMRGYWHPEGWFSGVTVRHSQLNTRDLPYALTSQDGTVIARFRTNEDMVYVSQFLLAAQRQHSAHRDWAHTISVKASE